MPRHSHSFSTLEIIVMKQFLFGAALVLGMGLSASNAHALYPTTACGPSNEGETVTLEDYNWWGGVNRRAVYQCWGSNWMMIELWYCDGQGSCIVQ
jgi:hypothetical protein